MQFVVGLVIGLILLTIAQVLMQDGDLYWMDFKEWLKRRFTNEDN